MATRRRKASAGSSPSNARSEWLDQFFKELDLTFPEIHTVEVLTAQIDMALRNLIVEASFDANEAYHRRHDKEYATSKINEAVYHLRLARVECWERLTIVMDLAVRRWLNRLLDSCNKHGITTRQALSPILLRIAELKRKLGVIKDNKLTERHLEALAAARSAAEGYGKLLFRLVYDKPSGVVDLENQLRQAGESLPTLEWDAATFMESWISLARGEKKRKG